MLHTDTMPEAYAQCFTFIQLMKCHRWGEIILNTKQKAAFELSHGHFVWHNEAFSQNDTNREHTLTTLQLQTCWPQLVYQAAKCVTALSLQKANPVWVGLREESVTLCFQKITSRHPMWNKQPRSPRAHVSNSQCVSMSERGVEKKAKFDPPHVHHHICANTQIYTHLSIL